MPHDSGPSATGEDKLPRCNQDRRNPAHRPRAHWTSQQPKQRLSKIYDYAALPGIIVNPRNHM
jgi:hypothetical protein